VARLSFRTPLAQVRGLGAAGEGAAHWWRQRLTAVALVPLTLWLCFALAALPGADYAQLRAWVATPLNALLLMVALPTALYHGYLGVQVVVEDYVHLPWLRMVLIVGSGFAATLLGGAALLAVLMLALGP